MDRLIYCSLYIKYTTSLRSNLFWLGSGLFQNAAGLKKQTPPANCRPTKGRSLHGNQKNFRYFMCVFVFGDPPGFCRRQWVLPKGATAVTSLTPAFGIGRGNCRTGKGFHLIWGLIYHHVAWMTQRHNPSQLVLNSLVITITSFRCAKHHTIIIPKVEEKMYYWLFSLKVR